MKERFQCPDTNSLYPNQIGEFHGNPPPLEIESPTVPPGRFSLPRLRPVHLSAPAGLHEVSLHRPIDTNARRGRLLLPPSMDTTDGNL
jgi:hypothetical protein